MVNSLKFENNMIAWLVRIGGWILSCVGFSSIAGPLRSFASIVPLFGGLVGWMNTMHDKQLNRRAILRGGALLLATASTLKPNQIFGETLSADDQQPLLRVALITDLHHADKPPSGTRYYRETLTKFSEAATKYAALKPNFVVEVECC